MPVRRLPVPAIVQLLKSVSFLANEVIQPRAGDGGKILLLKRGSEAKYSFPMHHFPIGRVLMKIVLAQDVSER